MKEKPNYYAVIPSEVRYSKKLTPNSLQKRDKNIKKLFENSTMNTKIDNQQIIINIPTAVSSEI